MFIPVRAGALSVILLSCFLSMPVNTSYAGDERMDKGQTLESQFYKVKVFETPVPVRDLFFARAGDVPPLQMEELRGKWVLLNLWATWCPPCIDELPELDRLQSALGPEMTVLAVSVDRKLDTAQIKNFMDRRQLQHLTPFLDSARILERKLDTGLLPVTYLIDPNGYMRAAYFGPAKWGSKEGQDFVRNLKAKFRS